MVLFCTCQLSFPNMGGVTVSSGTLSADALGYFFRAKGSESCLFDLGYYSMANLGLQASELLNCHSGRS
jgi:hypothetical protein